MKCNSIIPTLLAATFVIGMDASGQQNKDTLKDDLETCYNTWRLQMVRSDYDGWRTYTSAYRQIKVRNLIVSEKRKFPAAVFENTIPFPPLAPLRYIGAIRKGNTAAATYYGKIDFGIGGNPTDNALVLLFTLERGKWKYDQARFFNLANIPDVKERLKRGDKTILEEQDEIGRASCRERVYGLV